MVWAVAGIALGALLVVTHVRASRPHRLNSWVLAAATATLALFAFALDMAVAVLEQLTGRGTFAAALDCVESGGELAAMTLMLFVSWAIWARQRFAEYPRERL